MNLPKCTT